MRIFSYHLATTTPATSLRVFARPPCGGRIAGLHHAECMSAMKLGAPILSPARLQLRKLAVFACWEEESALDEFLENSELGRILSTGWHLRLELLRRWGRFPEFDDPPAEPDELDASHPVVAVTVARLKLPQVLRFTRWGRPVEEQVRDHPETTLALAAFRPPRTFSTFSIWKSQQAMTAMVHGRGEGPGARRHAEAMVERTRQDFHRQFTTLRFRARSEQGEWLGRGGFVPNG